MPGILRAKCYSKFKLTIKSIDFCIFVALTTARVFGRERRLIGGRCMFLIERGTS